MGDKKEKNYEATDTRSTTIAQAVRKKTELTCLVVLPTIPPVIALVFFLFIPLTHEANSGRISTLFFVDKLPIIKITALYKIR